MCMLFQTSCQGLRSQAWTWAWGWLCPSPKPKRSLHTSATASAHVRVWVHVQQQPTTRMLARVRSSAPGMRWHAFACFAFHSWWCARSSAPCARESGGTRATACASVPARHSSGTKCNVCSADLSRSLHGTYARLCYQKLCKSFCYQQRLHLAGGFCSQ